MSNGELTGRDAALSGEDASRAMWAATIEDWNQQAQVLLDIQHIAAEARASVDGKQLIAAVTTLINALVSIERQAGAMLETKKAAR